MKCVLIFLTRSGSCPGTWCQAKGRKKTGWRKSNLKKIIPFLLICNSFVYCQCFCHFLLNKALINGFGNRSTQRKPPNPCHYQLSNMLKAYVGNHTKHNENRILWFIVTHNCILLNLMLLVANLTNTKWCKETKNDRIPGTGVFIWEYSVIAIQFCIGQKLPQYWKS